MGLIREDEVVVKVRTVRDNLTWLGRKPDAACSFRYDTRPGAYVVTREELARIREHERKRGKKIISIVRDQSAFFRCWKMR